MIDLVVGYFPHTNMHFIPIRRGTSEKFPDPDFRVSSGEACRNIPKKSKGKLSEERK